VILASVRIFSRNVAVFQGLERRFWAKTGENGNLEIVATGVAKARKFSCFRP
jgi:hypothetical protein